MVGVFTTQGACVAASDHVEVEELTATEAWMLCGDLFCDAFSSPGDTSQQALQSELVFCLLGGYGIVYELALSATGVILELDPFGAFWSKEALEKRIRIELSLPQFDPPRADGEPRRYRFPSRKASLLVRAREWILSQGDLANTLKSMEEEERRLLLCECPGVGPKTGSWILRNLGLAERLAILDVHVVRALQESGRLDIVALPRDYALAEEAFHRWCNELNAPPFVFDLFLWEHQRGSLFRP